MKLTGKIIHGKGRGHALGVPTVNLEIGPIELDYGVYAVMLNLNGESFPAVMNWGGQPTFEDSAECMEVHILDFEGDLYGETAELEIIEKIREVRKFSLKEELIAQIQHDIETARILLEI